MPSSFSSSCATRLLVVSVYPHRALKSRAYVDLPLLRFWVAAGTWHENFIRAQLGEWVLV